MHVSKNPINLRDYEIVIYLLNQMTFYLAEKIRNNNFLNLKNQTTMPVRKLLDFLNANNVKFVSIHHSKAYTAMEIAHSAHIHGHELAKTVMIKVDGKMAMAVLPATRMIDLDVLKKAIGANQVELATEPEFVKMFPDCEIGAMPPFGNLFGMEVYVSSVLAEDEEIAFNAGFLTELIRMWYQDFAELVNPKVLHF